LVAVFEGGDGGDEDDEDELSLPIDFRRDTFPLIE
jgi:hypothetical protein